MKKKEKGSFIYLECEKFSQSGLATHAFCTRKGGTSKPPYDSLNLSHRVGDRNEAVFKNYEIVKKKFCLSNNHFITVNQSHGDNILVIDNIAEDTEKLSLKAERLKKDAIITNKPLIPIGILTADCVPVMFLDRKNKVVALVHAGWRGTVLRIGQKVFSEMKKFFGSKPDDCLVCIGPSIKKCCYEVGEDIIENMKKNFPEWNDFMIKKRNRWNLGIDDLNLFQMLESGIPLKNISKSDMCTSCNKDLFFSYRAEKGNTGRCLSFIMLK